MGRYTIQLHLPLNSSIGFQIPETTDVLQLLKDGDISVAESSEEGGTTDAGGTASNHRNTTAV